MSELCRNLAERYPGRFQSAALSSIALMGIEAIKKRVAVMALTLILNNGDNIERTVNDNKIRPLCVNCAKIRKVFRPQKLAIRNLAHEPGTETKIELNTALHIPEQLLTAVIKQGPRDKAAPG